MYSRPNQRRPAAFKLLALALLAGMVGGCGHKAPPQPPPLMFPAPTRDLTIKQRGSELILEFGYPQTTVSGLPLAEVERVEYWALERPLQAWSTPDLDAEDKVDGEEGDPTEDAELLEEAPDDQAIDMDTEATVDPLALSEEQLADAEESLRKRDLPEELIEQRMVLLRQPSQLNEEQREQARALLEQLGLLEEEMAEPVVEPSREERAAVDATEFVATAQLRLTLQGEELASATSGDRIIMRFALAEAESDQEIGYHFAVKTFADSKLGSPFSNVVVLVRREVPEPPQGLKVEAEAGGIRLSWTNELAESTEPELGTDVPTENVESTEPAKDESEDDAPKGFRIYRRDAKSRGYVGSLAQPGATVAEYLDRTAQYGNQYIYAVTTVGELTPSIESPLSVEHEINYEDRFPPPAPTSPIALPERGRVRLLWSASPVSDLAGYIVFRRESGGEFSRLNTEPLLDLEYDDRSVTSGRTYEYQIAAIDQTGNQGDPGEIVKASVP